MKRSRLFQAISLALSLTLLLSACASGNAGGSAASGTASSSAPEENPGLTQPAPEETEPLLGSFTATDLDGNEVDQTIFAEHDLTMVNIWATFCGPCLREMPDLGAIQEEYKDKGLQVVGIVIDVFNQDGTISESQVALAKEVVEKTGAAYLHLLPSDDLITAKLYAVTSVPETIFVDKTGAVVGESYLGSRAGDSWKAIIDELLAKVQPAEGEADSK